MTTNLPVHIIEAEPRVLDTDLARMLGMTRPNMIRANLIEANREELESFGGLHSAQANPGRRGGRPSAAYYLNRQQATLICILSKTPTAKMVRRQVIDVFEAWQSGEIGPKAEPQLDLLPPPSFASDSVTKDDLRKQCEWQSRRFAMQIDEVEHRVEELLVRFAKAISGEFWKGEGHLKKHLPAILAGKGYEVRALPTPETTFVTAYEVCGLVIDDEHMHRALTSIVATRLVEHARKHLWPQGQTEKRTRADGTHPTFPRARVDEWLSAGGRDFIEAENRRLHARGGQQAALRLVPSEPEHA